MAKLQRIRANLAHDRRARPDPRQIRLGLLARDQGGTAVAAGACSAWRPFMQSTPRAAAILAILLILAACHGRGPLQTPQHEPTAADPAAAGDQPRP
jgi:predicted small lipoprotein YifL